MEEQVNPLEMNHSLSVVLPSGLEDNATVHGSKPVMDLLVTLCASYHLNPSEYTVEVLSPNKNHVSFKPNSPIGSLEAETIVLKPRGAEEKIRRPYMPEATVRLLINYNKSHKAVVRVNPRVPVETLLPAVCDKCELNRDTTVLLRDARSTEPLDLTKSLDQHGLREVFAKDAGTEARRQPRALGAEIPSPPAAQDPPKKEKKPRESTGFLSLFRRKKKKSELEIAASAPASPGLDQQMSVGVREQNASCSDTLPADWPKKRRAPQPPVGASQSVPDDLGGHRPGGAPASADSPSRTTKRRAPLPPPPRAHSRPELGADARVEGNVDPLNTLQELRESDESGAPKPPLSSASSPDPSRVCSAAASSSSSSSSRPSLDPYLPSFRGRDLSEARAALAKVLTSSVSTGRLVRRLRSSATLPRLYAGSSFTPAARRGPDRGVFGAERRSVLGAELAAEPEWEDPLRRKGMTTFKVVPSDRRQARGACLTHRCQVMVERDPESEATGPEEESYSPRGSDAATPSPSQELSDEEVRAPDSPPPPQDVDGQDLAASAPPEAGSKNQGRGEEEEEEEEEDPKVPSEEIQASDGPDSPPPPQDVDSQGRAAAPPSEAEGRSEGRRDEGAPEVTAEGTSAARSDDGGDKLSSDDGMDARDRSERPLSQDRNADDDEEGEDDEEEEEEEEDAFPAPPPPVFFNEDIGEDKEIEKEEREDASAASPPPGPESSEDHPGEAASPPPPPPPRAFLPPTANGQTRAFAEAANAAPQRPGDEASAAPSRFAQAVALAVRRSRLRSDGAAGSPQASRGPHGALPSAPRSTYQYGA